MLLKIQLQQQLRYFRFKARYFFIKAFSWEYWPMWLVYFPASLYFVYLSIKARSFFFFSAANPSIETGGMFFESKWSIFQLMPEEFYPSTILVHEDDDLEIILKKMEAAQIIFPVIAKPDRGERGWCVKKITNINELTTYVKSVKVPFLIQTYIAYPLELSVFYYRNPESEKGVLTSITLKKLLAVTGDGISTIDELVRKCDRAFLQYKRLKSGGQIDFNKILNKGDKELLVPYGNHVLGAQFMDYNHIIDDALINTFDKISKQIDGFYFGRFDLRCTSIEDLKQGNNIAILELNGSGAEPAHIYTPGFSFFKAQMVIIKHYSMMYQAAIANHIKGVPFMSFKSFIHTRNLEKEYKQSVQYL
jgi:hypothetical protein